MSNNDFLMDAAQLFKSYRPLYELNSGKKELYGIEGKYRLYCILNGNVYDEVFDMQIVYKNEMLLPYVYLLKKIIPRGFNHYYLNNDEYVRCCLGLDYEILNAWGEGRKAKVFFENIIDIYLINMIEFDKKKCYVTGDWEHGARGVLNYYSHLLNIPNNNILVTLYEITYKIKHKKKFNGHQLCLCGSRKKIRNCHQQQFNKFIDGILKDKAREQAFFNDMIIVKREIEK